MDIEIRLIEGFMVSLLFLGYMALWRAKRLKMMRNRGDDPEVIHTDDRPSQKFFARLSRLMAILIVLLIGIHSSIVDDNISACKVSFLDNSSINVVGFVLGVLGLLLCWRAQQEMGNSWRVGIDRNKPTDLVTTGVFKRVRNPTYSGLFLICTGSFLIFPTIYFMLWGAVFYISIEFQVRIEEEFLSESHGERYRRYLLSTKRYIPYLY